MECRGTQAYILSTLVKCVWTGIYRLASAWMHTSLSSDPLKSYTTTAMTRHFWFARFMQHGDYTLTKERERERMSLLGERGQPGRSKVPGLNPYHVVPRQRFPARGSGPVGRRGLRSLGGGTADPLAIDMGYIDH